VHLATLTGGGDTVAVKVQHPNLTERLSLDMAILRRLAKLAARLAPDMRVGETADQFAINFEVCVYTYIYASTHARTHPHIYTSTYR